MPDPRESLPDQITVRGVRGIPDLRPGDDLAGIVLEYAGDLTDGDVVVVTSKAVSKVEGRLVSVPLDAAGRDNARRRAVDDETRSVVAQRGPTKIVRTSHGLTMAAAGVDASNVPDGEIALLPVDPDASAARLRAGIRERAGVDVAVVVTDTAGRVWRDGLTDLAIGSAGIPALRDLRGGPDTHGHALQVTAMAQIDEIAAASELVRGKLARVPVAVLSGLPWVEDGSVAHDLVRPLETDMFSLGTRDVVPASTSAPETTEDRVLDRLLDAAVARSADGEVRIDVTANPLVLVHVPGGGVALGVAVGRLLVALRAEGLAGRWGSTERSDTVEVRVGPARPYLGRPA